MTTQSNIGIKCYPVYPLYPTVPSCARCGGAVKLAPTLTAPDALPG
jgi:hypothetical protein